MPGKFYIEGIKKKVDISSILAALVVYHGETTAIGAGDGSTLDCDDLALQPDFDGHIVVILSGDYKGQARGISGATTTGVVPVSPPFSGMILAGVEFLILSIRAAEIDLTPIQDQTDKLAGEEPITGSATADWNTAEAIVASFGADDTRYKVHSLLLGIHNLVGTAITVRFYAMVHGTPRIVYEQVFDATTDPPGLWIINGTIGIHNPLAVSIQSNHVDDNGQAVDYDCMLEAM